MHRCSRASTYTLLWQPFHFGDDDDDDDGNDEYEDEYDDNDYDDDDDGSSSDGVDNDCINNRKCRSPMPPY